MKPHLQSTDLHLHYCPVSPFTFVKFLMNQSLPFKRDEFFWRRLTLEDQNARDQHITSKNKLEICSD